MEHSPRWTVLLIGGPSGAGKTTIGRQISRHLGIDFMMVDDLRLAFQHSQAALPDGEETAALYAFWGDLATMWAPPPAALRDGMITVGRAMTPAIEVVVMNHVDQRSPIVVEGDNILPTLLARPYMQERATGGRVAAVFLIEPDEQAFAANFLARGGWSRLDQAPAWMPTQIRAKWLYAQWLAEEARRHGLPIVEPRPWATLTARLQVAAESKRPI